MRTMAGLMVGIGAGLMGWAVHDPLYGVGAAMLAGGVRLGVYLDREPS